MEESVEKLFQQIDLKKVIQLWKGTGDIEALGDFENYVCSFQSEDGEKILRLTHDSHRSENEVLAEIHWINFLNGRGVQACKPLLSKNQKWVEAISIEGSSFWAVGFERAEGILIDPQDDPRWFPKLVSEGIAYQWGKITGKMHALAQEYTPESPLIKRPQWHEDDLVTNAKKYLPDSYQHLRDELEEHTQWMHDLPKGPTNFGLTHYDLHSHNFLWKDGGMTIFDFDDVEYQWFIFDIGIPIYHLISQQNNYQGLEILEDFFVEFMKGYLQENRIEESWFKELPRFFHFRRLVIACVFFKKMPDMTEAPMQQFLKSLETEHPCSQLDYTKLYRKAVDELTQGKMEKVSLRPLEESEFEEYMNLNRYAKNTAEAEGVSLEEGIKIVKKQNLRILPQGIQTPNQFMFVVVEKESQQTIGKLWFALQKIGEKESIYLYNIELKKEYQGHGYGKAVMGMLEKRAEELGVNDIRLHAFGSNERAWKLYKKIGYEFTNVRMKKEF